MFKYLTHKLSFLRVPTNEYLSAIVKTYIGYIYKFKKILINDKITSQNLEKNWNEYGQPNTNVVKLVIQNIVTINNGVFRILSRGYVGILANI